jgi:hypothetical protein
MTLFLGFMVVITLVMWCVPDSPAGKLLLRQLVETPADHLARLKRHHLIYAVLLAGMALAGGEMLVLLGPEALATYAIYLDGVLVTYALAAYATARNSLRYARLRWRGGGRVRRVVRARRRRRAARRVLPPANDDDPVRIPLAA